MDLSMPALLGYFMTMIYNPNNVSIEASPFTTVAEMTTGDDLCRMFGFNVDPDNKELPLAWGHIVCGGTVANLESVRIFSIIDSIWQRSSSRLTTWEVHLWSLSFIMYLTTYFRISKRLANGDS